MTIGWAKCRLVELTSKIGSGATPRGGGESYKEYGVPLIRSLNVHDSGFRTKNLAFIDDIQALALSNAIVEPGDVLLNITGASVARCCVVPNKIVPARVNQHVSILRPLKEKLLPRFLYYMLTSNAYKNRLLGIGESAGSTRQALTKSQLQGMVIELPEAFSEQQRIVSILDEAFAGIATAKANAERNLRNAQEMFDARVWSIFNLGQQDWPRKTLREVATDFGRGKSKHRPRNDPALYGGPYPFIQTGDVRNSSHLISGYSQTYSEVGLVQSKLWPQGTLCITIAANIAETGILGFDACFPDSVIGVVADPKQTSNKYLEYLLQSVKADLKAKGKGSAQDNINLGTFENERLPFPDLGTQARIVQELDAIRSSVADLESIYTRKLTALDELKQSLLHQAFSGQLT